MCRHSLGLLPNIKQLIKGGEYANMNQFAAAAVLLRRNEHGEWAAFCSAVVLSNKHIMTAAHCVTDKPRGYVFAFHWIPDRRSNVRA